MKKITFILFALIAGTTFAQTEEGTADVNAEIVSPISIAEGTPLNFGKIIGAVTGGDVTISNDGTTRTIDASMDVPSSAFSSAAFEVTASNLYSYSITIDDSTITDGSNPMDVTFTHDKLATANVGNGTAQTVNVGGTLTVGNNQPSGLYEGTVTVQVAYE
jgi:spore coat protein U-like protein